jgi:TRAP-type C4-dicarboxylate transport system substrate-binding protein
MTISSSRIVVALLVTAMFCCTAVDAATFKIATVTPEGSQWMNDMKAGADEIKERTEGRVQIKIFGGGIMGNDKKILGQIRIGTLQGGALTPSALGSRYPDINLYGMPLVFDSEEEAAYVRERFDERLGVGLEEAGWVTFGFAAGGFANIMSNTPVRGLADLEGKRVWVLEGDTISYASMEALSLSPVTLPLTDVLTGLQTGLIDIVAISPIAALVLQWHTKIKYITEMPLAYSLGFMAIDKRAFEKISTEDQAVFREVMTAIYANFDKENLVDNRGALDALFNSGIEPAVFDPEEIVRIRALLEITNRELGAKGEFTIELYDEMMGYVEEYRSAHP